jgi:hypothetical protein
LAEAVHAFLELLSDIAAKVGDSKTSRDAGSNLFASALDSWIDDGGSMPFPGRCAGHGQSVNVIFYLGEPGWPL